MNWSIIAIISLVAAVAQTTLAPAVALGPIRPDWILVLAVFFGLYGRRGEAIICGWALGFAVDVLTIERMGLMSLAYTLVSWSSNGIRDAVFLKSTATHLSVTVFFGIIVYFVVALYTNVQYRDDMGNGLRSILVWAGIVAYSALWAAPIDAALLRLAPLLGLSISRNSNTRWISRRAHRV